ncbi:hypothetical protein [Bacillus sp. RO1]|uniref:hypothetical protein n=1 Tax=Bacillus sp. RO1 TaxID=2722703 RepID=UPI0014565148|nr:hypothetical protein [Bacillus sp. RO1]NLP51274.1 hypothetical protein [Bacillus sp. RO1]
MKKVQVPVRYKNTISIVKWTTIIASIIISFFTLETSVAVPVSILLVAIGIFIERIIYTYNLFYINPMPKIHKEGQQTFVAVGFDEFNNVERPFIGLVYRTQEEAKEEFQYFKALNGNRYSDKDNEIILSYVFEDEKRYTFFVYPNLSRNRTMDNIEDIKLREGHNKEKILNVSVLSFVRFFPSSFTGEGNLKDILKHQVLPRTPIAFQTFYLENGEIKHAQKKPILKYHLRILNREELTSKDTESGFPWQDMMKYFYK